MQRAYFVVEGPHDVEVVGRLLRTRGLSRIRYLRKLDTYWEDLVPRTFPTNDDLLRRVPAPTFFASETHSVAVHAAGGRIEAIANTMVATLTTLHFPPDGVALIVDADFTDPPRKTWQEIGQKISSSISDTGDEPGSVGLGPPRCGIYILPDNENKGTLENLLLLCGQKAYPKLSQAVKTFIDPMNPNDEEFFPRGKDRKDLKKPAGKPKAIVGSISNLLRPGKAMQVSIQDNHWLRDPSARALPEVQALQTFIDQIIG